jgi:hypothetical protein
VRGMRNGNYMPLLLFLRASRGAAGLKSVRYGKLGVACLCPYPTGDKRRFSSLHCMSLAPMSNAFIACWVPPLLQLDDTVQSHSRPLISIHNEGLAISVPARIRLCRSNVQRQSRETFCTSKKLHVFFFKPTGHTFWDIITMPLLVRQNILNSGWC